MVQKRWYEAYYWARQKSRMGGIDKGQWQVQFFCFTQDDGNKKFKPLHSKRHNLANEKINIYYSYFPGCSTI